MAAATACVFKYSRDLWVGFENSSLQAEMDAANLAYENVKPRAVDVFGAATHILDQYLDDDEI